MCSEKTFSYRLGESMARTKLGLIVLQADETLECEMRRMIPDDVGLYVSRIASAPTVSTETLSQMAHDLSRAAKLFPPIAFDIVGYGCTSGAAVIGEARIRELVATGCNTATITEPISALLDACRHLRLSRLAMLSPYVAEVSATLRQTLAAAGVQTPRFGSFDEAVEANVARIDAESVKAAAIDLYKRGDVDAIFISCTNLQTLDIIPPIESACDCVVLSSNLVLGWRMLSAVGVKNKDSARARLLAEL